MNADWETVRLGDFCQKIGSGSTPKGGSEVYLEKGEVSLIRSQNIYNDGFNPNGIVYLTTEAADKLKNVGVEKNDILLNITGDSVARVCLVDAQYLPARVNQHVLIIRPNPTNFDARFLRYYLVTPKIQNTLLGIAAVGATRNALTKGMIESLEVPKPNLSVQKSIADKLESLDNKITLNRQINQTLEAMAQALFKSWFVDFEPVKAKIAALSSGGNDEYANLAAMSAISGKSAQALFAMQTNQPEQYQQLYATAELFPSEMVESELGEIPKGWEVKSFGDVSNCFDSKRIPLSKQQRELKQGTVPYYGATSVMDYVNDYIFDGVYLLLGEDGSVLKDDGTPFIQYIWGKSWVNNHAHVIQGKNGISTEQLMLFIASQNITAYVTGAVQLKLNQKNMNSIPIIVASNEINAQFYKLVEPFFAEYRLLSESSTELVKVRDFLLPKLLSGELSVDGVGDV
jgi:type I restriction enzyme S subunit